MSRRYSESDQQKLVRDTLADFRAKGIDARSIAALHPGGVQETLKRMNSDLSRVRDQSQEQVAQRRADHRKTVRESNARVREEAKRFKGQ